MLSKIELEIDKLEKLLGLDSQRELPFSEETVSEGSSYGIPESDVDLYIGDNLPHLKSLADHSPQTVDLCYIDPPYNTGSKFLYNDYRKSPASGLLGSHAAWMEFMIPRLVAAKELLKESGIIAISIDDYEYAHLKILMDYIFGEGNFIGNVIVCRSKNGKGSRKNLASNHEYLLMYGKSSKAALRGQLDMTSYDKRDSFGNYRIDGLFRKKGHASLRTDRPNMYYPLYYNAETGEVSVEPRESWGVAYPVDSKGVERRWLWSKETASDRSWRLFSSKNGVIYVKNYAGAEGELKRTKVRTLWDESSFYTERATNEIKGIFGAKVFDTPKPLAFLRKIIDSCSGEDALVLDFFAGSGTTAHAVAELNVSSGAHRKCILMESDSEIPSEHLAKIEGFNTVAEITKARLSYIEKTYSPFKYSAVVSNDRSSATFISEEVGSA